MLLVNPSHLISVFIVISYTNNACLLLRIGVNCAYNGEVRVLNQHAYVLLALAFLTENFSHVWILIFDAFHD